jgi:Transposase and inactivated derivatives
VPKQHSSGGREKLGGISKQGDRYLRSLFTAGALAVIRYAKIHGTKHRPWLTALLARRPTKGRRHRARQQNRQNGVGDDG